LAAAWVRSRASASGLDEADRLRRGDENDASAVGRGGVLAVRRRIEIISGLQVIGADPKVTFDDEQLLAAWMVVQRHAAAGVDTQQKRRSAACLVVSEALDRDTDRGRGLPALLRAPHDTHLSLRGAEEYQISARRARP